MKLHIFGRYSALGASTRLRSLQYLPSLAAAGFEIKVSSFFDDAYLTALYGGKRSDKKLIGYFGDRLRQLRAARGADVIWFEKEALPWVPWAFERRLLPQNVPYVVDLDDAVFHRYDQHRSAHVRWLLGHKIDRVMQASACVTAGNEYLAARARNTKAPKVEIVPTVIDLTRYDTTKLAAPDGALRVGWIGTPQTWAELARPIQSALAPELARLGAVFRAVGAELEQRTTEGLEILPWSENSEVQMIRGMDIGIMPLPDTPWTRGKCGYKLIQYMACGLPVIASPVGVNVDIVEHGVNGFLAETPAEWENAVSQLLADPQLRARMGAAGRRKVETDFSLQVWADRVAEILRAACRKL